MNISTPCIKVCAIEPDSRLCRGCGRTLDEIARWSTMAEAERRAIIAALPERLTGVDRPPARRAKAR
ncbi:DUF1289 domain-containing protein [Chelatococcus reniformis]|uniref:Fe-S oxidoreductase n=1 Tax=Chelatococcus reniformis TaxID=1494448 RepID=A0A916UHY8_9HYPH|nr:DUF1289 domain-containing protein [Chelatococcus reniformis]GGC73311.1 Fe-S oxidoreductase [Chelatococcus reniformis]